MTEQNKKPEGEKTFTQDDVNRIVGERLAEDRKKAAADLEKREADLVRREFEFTAKEALKAAGLPGDMINHIKAEDEAGLKESIEALQKIKGNEPAPTGLRASFPSVKTKEKAPEDNIRKAMGLD